LKRNYIWRISVWFPPPSGESFFKLAKMKCVIDILVTKFSKIKFARFYIEFQEGSQKYRRMLEHFFTFLFSYSQIRINHLYGWTLIILSYIKKLRKNIKNYYWWFFKRKACGWLQDCIYVYIPKP
jgi:hypothetical protein